MVAKVTIETLF